MRVKVARLDPRQRKNTLALLAGQLAKTGHRLLMTRQEDWDPLAPEVLADPSTAYDELRRRCPVAYSEKLGWSVFRHVDVLEVVRDTETFSSVVSSHLAVPSGMDRPTHTPYRKLVESYFSAPKMAKFEATCRKIARERVARLPRPGGIELMEDFAHPFALDAQCAFTGWPREIQDSLRDWLTRSQQATLTGDRQAAEALGKEFESIVEAQLESRRAAGAQAPDDPTTGLLAAPSHWKKSPASCAIGRSAS